MEQYAEKLAQFFAEFGAGRKMVLSTAEAGKVSSRMMSVVQFSGCFWFQTDLTMRKYRQLAQNAHAALCTDNIQIEGICTELGHPMQNAEFCAAFQSCFKGSFDAYTRLENERLFRFQPQYIERWVYQDKLPYLEIFDLVNRAYSFAPYAGI